MHISKSWYSLKLKVNEIRENFEDERATKKEKHAEELNIKKSNYDTLMMLYDVRSPISIEFKTNLLMNLTNRTFHTGLLVTILFIFVLPMAFSIAISLSVGTTFGISIFNSTGLFSGILAPTLLLYSFIFTVDEFWNTTDEKKAYYNNQLIRLLKYMYVTNSKELLSLIEEIDDYDNTKLKNRKRVLYKIYYSIIKTPTLLLFTTLSTILVALLTGKYSKNFIEFIKNICAELRPHLMQIVNITAVTVLFLIVEILIATLTVRLMSPVAPELRKKHLQSLNLPLRKLRLTTFLPNEKSNKFKKEFLQN